MIPTTLLALLPEEAARVLPKPNAKTSDKRPKIMKLAFWIIAYGPTPKSLM
jgi:hypothetical protein